MKSGHTRGLRTLDFTTESASGDTLSGVPVEKPCSRALARVNACQGPSVADESHFRKPVIHFNKARAQRIVSMQSTPRSFARQVPRKRPNSKKEHRIALATYSMHLQTWVRRPLIDWIRPALTNDTGLRDAVLPQGKHRIQYFRVPYLENAHHNWTCQRHDPVTVF